MGAELKKLETGKTFTDITIRVCKDKKQHKIDKKKALELMIRASLLYPNMSMNSINQNLRKSFLSEGITSYKRQEIKFAQEEIEYIIKELLVTIGLEDGLEIKNINHKFV